MSDGSGSLNSRCADRLREAADLLHSQGANPFRVSAYRKAAATVLELPEDLQAIIDREGLPGLEALPNVGRGIAAALDGAEVIFNLGADEIDLPMACETLAASADMPPLPFVELASPTVLMQLSINDGPLAGRDGKHVTSRALRDRLFR